ncbi:hypothetical protein GCM10011367_23460 [Marinicauda pacifica]|jgi:hypothetical protein|uniref:Invasion associated locus B family protein n=1 Tax=Marinicauda pacifica TaxID=1133559 RepID=A0A4S2H953_9PROT|nr:invasion associated locus B family protein [Marinicauda pacifica]TGY92326.1 hypothetical protein E5162_11810 [Marinicauda pacifica]GGE47933.1 hypothetical protein GCM10011367_23460 [Marinicauda pacifica]
MRRTALSALFISLLCSAGAAAQEPAFQGEHNDWRVFTRGEGDAQICYATSRPTDSRPGSVDHGDVYFLVSTWASDAAEEQPSFLAGYALQPNTPPLARVGSSSFTMYVSEREGFIEDLRDEQRLVDAMRRGATMRVEAMSARGTATAYEFSLSGVTAALDQVEALCD